MPFTFAHPAAILPLRRFRFLQTVPLVIGSMVPDTPYFLPARFARTFVETHSFYSSFTVDLPLGLALLILTLFLREPLTILLGARARWLCLRSIDRFYEQPLHWPMALFSLLVGTWTHLAWDSVTHETGWTAARVPALSAPISVFGWDTPMAHLLQYLSSVVGLVLLAVWFRGLLKGFPRMVSADQSRPRARWALLIAIAVISLSIGVSRALLEWHATGYYHLEFLLLTRTIGWFMALYLAAGFVVSLSEPPEPAPAS